jgi:hypothetical protein
MGKASPLGAPWQRLQPASKWNNGELIDRNKREEESRRG